MPVSAEALSSARAASAADADTPPVASAFEPTVLGVSTEPREARTPAAPRPTVVPSPDAEPALSEPFAGEEPAPSPSPDRAALEAKTAATQNAATPRDARATPDQRPLRHPTEAVDENAPEPTADGQSQTIESSEHAAGRDGDSREGSSRRERQADARHDGPKPLALAPDRLAGSEPAPSFGDLATADFAAADPAPDLSGDALPTERSAEAVASQTSAEAARAKSAGPSDGVAPRLALSAAWLQKLGEAAPRAIAGAWQTVRVSLGEGEGEVTVQAQREDEHVRVALGFSDPALRTVMTEQSDRLQSALEARYGTDVDLSFTDGRQDDGSASPERQPAPASGSAPRRTADADALPPAPVRTGAHNEWVG